MKILVTLHELAYSSGAPRSTFYVIRELIKQGHSVTVLTALQGPLQGDLIALGVKVFHNPHLLNDPKITYLAAKDYDLVFVPTLVAFQCVYGAKGAGKPVVFSTGEGMFLANQLPGNFVMQNALKMADEMVFSSPILAKFAKTYVGPIETSILAHSADPEPHPNYQRTFEKQEGKTYVLQLGSVEYRKGQDVAINALEQLKDPNIVLYIVGRILDQGFANQLITYVREHNLPVFFTNEIPHAVAKSYLQHSDIVVMPTRTDASPVSVLEAQAFGKPVLAADDGNISETIEDGKTGLLFEQENYVQMAEKLRTLVDDVKLRKDLGRQGKAFVETERTLEKYTKGFIELFSKLTGGV